MATPKRNIVTLCLLSFGLVLMFHPTVRAQDLECQISCGLARDACQANAQSTWVMCVNLSIDQWSECTQEAWNNLQTCAWSCNPGDNQCDNFCWTAYYEELDSCNQYQQYEAINCEYSRQADQSMCNVEYGFCTEYCQ